MAFTVLALFQWANALNCRSRDKSIFSLHPFSNPYLIGAFVIVFFLQFLAIYHPTLNTILRTTPLAINEWIFAGLVASSIIVIEEIRKALTKKIA